MKKAWFLLLATRNLAEASIVKGMLEENHIQVVLLNKQDSSYLIGDVELYVPAHLKEMARDLLAQALRN